MLTLRVAGSKLERGKNMDTLRVLEADWGRENMLTLRVAGSGLGRGKNMLTLWVAGSGLGRRFEHFR